jgi:hypothetical protein
MPFAIAATGARRSRSGRRKGEREGSAIGEGRGAHLPVAFVPPSDGEE